MAAKFSAWISQSPGRGASQYIAVNRPASVAGRAKLCKRFLNHVENMLYLFSG